MTQSRIKSRHRCSICRAHPSHCSNGRSQPSMCSAPDNKCKDREPPLSPFAMSLSHRPSKLSTDVPSSRLARRKYNTLSLNPRRGHMVQNAEASSDWNRLPASMPASTQPRSSRNNPPLRPPSTTTSQTSLKKPPTTLNISAPNTNPPWRRTIHDLSKRHSQISQHCTQPSPRRQKQAPAPPFRSLQSSWASQI